MSILTREAVVDIDAASVSLEDRDGDRRRVPARTAIWAAGVIATPFARATLAARAGAKVDRAGRVEVLDDLSLPGHPELPEVEALAGFLRERAVGRVVARVDLVAISALKTFDPPLSALPGLEVTEAGRHGKFLDLDVSGVHLVVHLARAGWLHWREKLPPGSAPARQGARWRCGSGWTTTPAST